MIKELVAKKVHESLNKAFEDGMLGELTKETMQNMPELAVEKTKNPEFGDYSVNVSVLSRFAKMPPQKIAQTIVNLISSDELEASFIAGFINFKTGKSLLNASLGQIIEKKQNYGKNNLGNGEKVLLEYVSANPTGPLHIGHGRWAAVGSSLANLMKLSGYEVTQEFYINDAGNQINNLGKSLWIRVLQEMEIEADFPQTEEEGAKNYYAGEFLIDPAKEYLKQHKTKAEEFYKQNQDPLNPSEEVIMEMSSFAKSIMLESQKQLLSKFRTEFDIWYSESTLHQLGEVKDTVEKLKALGKTFEQDGALWFKSSEYGDDQDRVIIKNDGNYTYLTADVAYHYEKLQRGFDKLINIWGADHHGYVARIKASIAAIGGNTDCLEVLLGQLVNLIISGEQVRMGKRRKMLTLEDLIDEVGVDATRFWMVMRSIDTALDFDVELAKSNTDDNPVFYVQYAHARCCSILRTAVSARFDQENKKELPPIIDKESLKSLLDHGKFNENILDSLWRVKNNKELESTSALVLKLEAYEDLIALCAKLRTPYMIARYLQELARDFHHFYTFTRVLNADEPVMKSRLVLVDCVRQVFANALGIIGVSAPESM